MLDQNEKDYILQLASSDAPLDKSPKHNWVEDAGGLPPYVRKLARGIMKNGHDLSSAISIAIARIKVWAAGGSNVNADTRAKAVKALAQWESAKAKNKVKLSYDDGTEKFDYLVLSNISSFDTDIVRSAWDARQVEAQRAYAIANPVPTSNSYPTLGGDGYQYQWICELGTDYVITSVNTDQGKSRYRYPYSVDDDYNVSFEESQKIIQVWVVDDDDLTPDEYTHLSNIPTPASALSNIVKLAAGLKTE